MYRIDIQYKNSGYGTCMMVSKNADNDILKEEIAKAINCMNVLPELINSEDLHDLNPFGNDEFTYTEYEEENEIEHTFYLEVKIDGKKVNIFE